MLAVFICVTIAVTAVVSFLFYIVAKRLKLLDKSLIILISILNVLFCAAFPLLAALFGGDARTADGAPSRGLLTVFILLAIWVLFYIFLITWRVILHSPAVRLFLRVPEPESKEPGAVFEDIYSESGKDTVDTAINLDKMGIITEIHHEADENDVKSLINRAFDSLNGGQLNEAAEYFYSAIEKRPPLNLEIQIAIQLSVIYGELGQADLALDILTGYNEQYRSRLTDEDKASLDFGVSMIETIVAGIGGDGHEKN